MRYKDSGNTHLDFHGATNTTIDYIVDNYGVDALHDILFKTGHDVYKSIRENLSKGNSDELLEHWRYYFDREEGDYTIEQHGDDVVFTVHDCPAVRHIKKLGLTLSAHFCDQTDYVNKGMCEGTPYTIDTKITGEGSCIQTLKRNSKV